MYFALGFLSAGIFALVVGPPIWRRALRLTRRHIEQTLPMTRAEIQAEKDQIRASFALSTRSHDQTIERLKAQVTEQWIDINRKREVITHLTAQGTLSADDIVALETRRVELEARVAAAELASATAATDRATNEKRLDKIRQKLAVAEETLRDLTAERETQRLEIIARDTELDNLRDALAAVKMTTTVDEVASAGFESEMSTLKANLAIERRRIEEQSERETESGATMRAAIAELKLREADLSEAHAKIQDLSLRLVDAEAAVMGGLALRDEKSDLEQRITVLEGVNHTLETKIDTLKQHAGTASAEETALLRGKLIEFGAAVARMAQERHEGPSLVTLLPPPPPEEEDAAPTGLADRIRALQHAGSL
jgi:chromosome segregation ATPase